MPLDNGYADSVYFECEGCGRESSLRQVYRKRGVCHKCRNSSWALVTEYIEGTDIQGNRQNHSILPTLLHVFGIETHFHGDNIVRIVTPHVPADEALTIAKAGLFTYRQMAFRYMELRRDIDAEAERQAMREKGGRNCLVCGAFFMPSAGKSWTGAGYCSPSCLAKSRVAVITETSEPLPCDTNVSTSRQFVTVLCRCGNEFQAAAMYRGTRRACPKCGERITVEGS